MAEIIKKLRQTSLGRDISLEAEKYRYRFSRETRAEAARAEADQLIEPLFNSAQDNPGSPEAKKLVLVGANVTSHVVSEVCDPGTQFYLNGVIESVRDWATDKGDLESLKRTRNKFLASDVYSDFFNLSDQPGMSKALRDTGDTVSLVDELLFGGVALDIKGMADLDLADKKGETKFRTRTYITGYDKQSETIFSVHGVLPTPDAGVYSLAEMSASSHKGVLSMGYSLIAAGYVASISTGMGAAAIARYYELEPHYTESNPLFQERINGIIKDTLNLPRK